MTSSSIEKPLSRKAKIVATIGPASQDEAVLERLINAGMNVARMNFSHGTHEQHATRIASIRRVATESRNETTDSNEPRMPSGS